MNRPRLGDTVIFADMAQSGEVVGWDRERVTVRTGLRGGKRRSVRVENLECVDPDEGLWQEMVPAQGGGNAPE